MARGIARQNTRLQKAVTDLTTLENAHAEGDLDELALGEVTATLNLLEKYEEALNALFEEAQALHVEAESDEAVWTLPGTSSRRPLTQ